MKSSVCVCLGLVAVSAALALVGCADDDGVEPGSGGGAAHAGSSSHGGAASAQGGATAYGGQPAHGDGAILCEVIGELCHEADSGSGAAHDCHQVGHVGDADGCARAFDGCIATCTAEEGAGGSGPAPDGHCAALGELCHVADDGDGPLHDCHQVGHVGDPAGCAAAFDDCATLCLAAREALEEGAGGAAAAGAGGVSSSGGASLVGGAGGAAP